MSLKKKCLSSNCHNELPFNARFCPICKTPAEIFDEYSIAGINSRRNLTFNNSYNIFETEEAITRANKNNEQSNTYQFDRKIEHNIQFAVKNTSKIHIVGANKLVIIPNLNSNQFKVFDIFDRAKKNYIVDSPLAIENTCQLLYDGLGFIAVNNNSVFRFLITRSNTIETNTFEYSRIRNNDSIVDPLLISNQNERLLIFLSNQELYCININNFNFQERDIKRINLPNNCDASQFLPLVYYNNSIFLLTNSGDLYSIALSNVLEERAEYNSTQNGETEIGDISKPFILNNEYLVYISNIGELNFLFSYSLRNNYQDKSNIKNHFQLDYNYYPLHSRNALLLQDLTSDNEYISLLPGTDSSVGRVKLRYRLNQKNYFIRKNILYSFSEQENSILKMNIFNRTFLPSIPLINRIGESVIPLSEMIYINGIIVICTKEHLLLYPDIK